jgi:hypothetical protein
MNKKNKIFLLTILTLFIFIFTLSKHGYLRAEDDPVWIDTSYWETRTHLVKDGYWDEKQKTRWVDTSYRVNQGYWSYDDYNVWVDTSRWVNDGYWKNETYREWVSSGYYKTENYYEWVKSGYTVYEWINSGYYQNYSYSVWVPSGYYKKQVITVWVPEYDPGWGINRQYPVEGSAGHATLKKYEYFIYVDTSHWETRYGSRYVDTSHWGSRYVDTSHYELRTRTMWVDTSHWEYRTRRTWVDTSYYASSGHWEKRTGRHWIDTSYIVARGYWETYTSFEWVDTSYYKTEKVWITSGYYSSPMHGEILVEKTPEFVFTKWHKNPNGDDAFMELKITWKIYNDNIGENEQPKKINKVYIYEDVVRYGGNGIDKVEIFNEKVNPSEEGSVSATVNFNYGGNEESILHIYLYSESGHAGHVSFPNPVNSFISINLYKPTGEDNKHIWLGGITNEIFEF